jgi:hypothetical protein
MLAAVRADRDELEAVQAVDAAVASRQIRRAQPRLAAVRAAGTELGFRAHSALPPAERGDEEAVAALDMRQGKQVRTPAAGHPERGGALRSIGSSSGLRIEEGSDLALILGLEIVHVE